jgi:hypothetical protein
MNDYIYFEIAKGEAVHHGALRYKEGVIYKVKRNHDDFHPNSAIIELSPLDVIVRRKEGVPVLDLLQEVRRLWLQMRTQTSDVSVSDRH